MKLLKNIRNGALAMSAASVCAMPVASADVGGAVIKKVLDIIYTMALYIGIILLVWSVVMLVLALKNEDADSKSRAIMLLAVSIALISIGFFLEPVLKVAAPSIFSTT